MKTSGVGCEPKFGLLGFLGHLNALPWTRRVLAHLGAWVVDILAPEQHYEEAQPCQPDHKQAWG